MAELSADDLARGRALLDAKKSFDACEDADSGQPCDHSGDEDAELAVWHL